MTMQGPLGPTKRHIQKHWIAPMLPMVVRRSMRRGLTGVWWRSDKDPTLPDGPVLLLGNHHSWWDLYLAGWLTQHLDRPMVGLMNPERLASFPFFETYGAVPADRPRPFVRRVRDGAVGVVFPEAGVRRPGQVVLTKLELERIERLGCLTNAPYVPLAIRVLMRGGQQPEAYLWLGGLHHESDAAIERLNAMLSDIEDATNHADPEQPLQGFELAFQGRPSTHESAARWSRWWR